jgi:hypothetical protein
VPIARPIAPDFTCSHMTGGINRVQDSNRMNHRKAERGLSRPYLQPSHLIRP